jgi:hypothetical protein
MPSKFQQWSAHDIVGPLNKAEIRAALLDYRMERSLFRTWDSIERLILGCSDEIKQVLYQCGVAKAKIEEERRVAGRKRRRDAQTMARNVRRHLGGFFRSGLVRVKN